jgi:Ca2+-binding RTX toxin-like protein
LGQPQDLAAINIARDRDLGIPTLNTLRRNLSGGLDATLTNLQQLAIANPQDPQLQAKIASTINLKLGLQAYTSWDDFGKNIIHPDALVNFIAAYALNGDLNQANMIVKLAHGEPLADLTTDETTAYQKLGWTDANAKANALNFLGASASANKGFEQIDAWIGGLAEKHVDNGELGSTFDAIFADQMTRLINGDRFYYLWRVQLGLPEFTQLISSITTEQFKDVIERTTGAEHLTGDVFFATDSHLELGEDPTLAKNNNASPDAAGHRYGDKVAALGIGVYSHVGTDISTNGTAIDVNGTEFGKYIHDTRTGGDTHETIGGTKFADYIDAGIGSDTVYGDDGNDILLGNAGSDHLYGENGDDRLLGDEDDDFIDGGEGNDQVYGGDGDDDVIGDNGNDRLFGEAGDDEIQGNNGTDLIEGGLGDDSAFGGYGNDIISGGAGNDKLYGEWGDDKLDGGIGDDLLIGGDGNDTLSGGEGNDTYLFNVGFGRDTIQDAGSSTLDTVKFGAGLTLDQFDISRQGEDLVFKVKGTNDTLTVEGEFGLSSTNVVEQFQFDNGAKTFTTDQLLTSTYPVNFALVGTAKNILKLGGDGKIKFSIKQDKSDRVTKIGVFKVDDLAGTIDGIAANSNNYAAKAVSKSEVVFSTIVNQPQGFDGRQISRIINGFQSNDLIGFYAIQDTGNGQTNTFFGTDANSQIFKASDLGNNSFNLNWHSADNRSLNLDLTVEKTTDSTLVGTNTQSKPEGLNLDFSQIVAPTIKVKCSLYREAAYNDSVGFYKVLDTSGAIQTTKGILKPQDAGYTQAALQNALDKAFGSGLDLNVSNQGLKSTDAIFDKSIYMPIIVANGTLAEAARSQNFDRIYTAFLGANSDKTEHIRLLGDNTFGFEDLRGGGDRDFNDIIVKMTAIG